jgi:excisionase family DNA binding protein
LKGRKREISEVEKRRRARQRALSISKQESAWKRGMSISEFCARYGVGKTKVYQEIKEKRLRAKKCGKRTIVGDEDAEIWFQHLPEAGQ